MIEAIFPSLSELPTPLAWMAFILIILLILAFLLSTHPIVLWISHMTSANQLKNMTARQLTIFTTVVWFVLVAAYITGNRAGIARVSEQTETTKEDSMTVLEYMQENEIEYLKNYQIEPVTNLAIGGTGVAFEDLRLIDAMIDPESEDSKRTLKLYEQEPLEIEELTATAADGYPEGSRKLYMEDVALWVFDSQYLLKEDGKEVPFSGLYLMGNIAKNSEGLITEAGIKILAIPCSYQDSNKIKSRISNVGKIPLKRAYVLASNENYMLLDLPKNTTFAGVVMRRKDESPNKKDEFRERIMKAKEAEDRETLKKIKSEYEAYKKEKAKHIEATQLQLDQSNRDDRRRDDGWRDDGRLERVR